MTYLAGLPTPFLHESTCSWIQRVCQVYDLSYGQLHAAFGIDVRSDPDLNLSASDIMRVARAGRLDLSVFSLMRVTLGRVAERKAIRSLVLRDELRYPVYRFCPLCFSEDGIPYLRLEWRFKAWEVCEAHGIDMPTKCWSCGRYLHHSRSILSGRGGYTLVPSLAHCIVCRGDQRNFPASAFSYPKAEVFQRKVRFQRAVLSALVHDYMRVEPLSHRFSVSEMATLVGLIGLDAPDASDKQLLEKMGRRDRLHVMWIIEKALTCKKSSTVRKAKSKELARKYFEAWREKFD
ncbi:hypothetical protein E4K72_08075 [Oxalobacteraceae bacterium OM1]|nr:hypothetical protein E4K72_08075 [Oxalobacteraceae bacterium OM1]